MANLRQERETQLRAIPLLPAILFDTEYRRATDLDPLDGMPLGKTRLRMIREILVREFPPLAARKH